jgi:RHS repeat-associated protein
MPQETTHPAHINPLPQQYNVTALGLDFGYIYFGARYYDPELSVWLSVDPLSDEYPSTSPYMYVLGNPVIFIDPNGMNHDWFENELTGDVYYNSSYGENDVGKAGMEGEGWKHMGENGMFDDGKNGQTDKAVLHNNGVTPNYIPNGDGSFTAEASMSGVQAKNFMGGMGYDFKPKTANVHVKTSTYAVMELNGPAQLTVVDESIYQKTGTYARKGDNGNYEVSGYYKLTPKTVLTVKSFFKQLVTPYRHVDTYEIRMYSYDKKIVNFNADAANVFLEFLQWGIENRKKQ